MSKPQVGYLLFRDSINLTYGTQSKTVAKDDPRFDRIMAAIRSGKLDEIPEIVNPTAAFEKAGIKVEDGLLTVKGLPMPAELNSKIMEYKSQNIPYQSLVNFWTKLEQNPSFHTRQFLFKFLENKGHSITEDGCFIGYRGVREDFKDSHSGTFDNTPGQVCEMPRHLVDDDHTRSCSHGLHVGGYEMAKGFGPKMVIVKVDPRDVVAVPDAYAGNKLRVCKFEVLSEAQAALQETVVNAKGQKIEKFSDDESDDAPAATGTPITGTALKLFEATEHPGRGPATLTLSAVKTVNLLQRNGENNMQLQEIAEHLRLHKLWYQNDPGGKRANLRGAKLYGANLCGADLRGADLSGAKLYGANLCGADLRGANLCGADLCGANLRGADLRGANLYGANLRGANLYGANLSQTLLENKAVLTFLYNKHTACYFGDGNIQIGCHKKTIAEWLESYKEVGKSNNYTDDEIEKYGKFIKGCANIQKEMK